MNELYWTYTVSELEEILNKYITDLGEKLGHIEITWYESENEFHLELVPVPAQGVLPRPGDGLNWSITPIAHISKYKDGYWCCDNLSDIKKAGRKIYFQFRDKFPIKRDLSAA